MSFTTIFRFSPDWQFLYIFYLIYEDISLTPIQIRLGQLKVYDPETIKNSVKRAVCKVCWEILGIPMNLKESISAQRVRQTQSRKTEEDECCDIFFVFRQIKLTSGHQRVEVATS